MNILKNSMISFVQNPKYQNMGRPFFSLIVFLYGLVSCVPPPDFTISKKNPEANRDREARLISAFFGLDNAMPGKSRGLWWHAPGNDGMPLVFSHEIDPTSLDAKHFKITTSKGDELFVDFATYKPAVEAFELRTILLIGEFGDAPENEPVEVTIIGDLMTRDGQNLKGQKVRVTPLEDGPFISYAEYFYLDDNYPYKAKGRGCDCPKDETEVVIRTVWAGGIKSPDGLELGEKNLENFSVKLLQGKDTITVKPFMLADLNDNDNNVDLCIRSKGIPISVSVLEGSVIDPRGDLNPFTEIKVLSRW
jgi:hypothetical protein